MKLLEIVTTANFASKLKRLLQIIKTFKGVEIEDGYDEDPGEAGWTRIDFDYSNEAQDSLNKSIELLDKVGFQHNFFNNALYIRPFGEKIKPRPFVYHTTNINNVESIMLHGLEISRSDCQKWGDDLFYCNAIFATNSNSPGYLFKGEDDDGSGVIRINTKKINNIWRQDLNLRKPHIVTYTDIAKDSLEYIGTVYSLYHKNLDTLKALEPPEAQDTDIYET